MKKSWYSPEQVAFGRHRRRSAMLEEMFKASLHKLMTREIQA